MKAYTTTILIFMICFLTSHLSTAQWSVGANIKVYDALGSFDENVNATPAGISFVGHKRGKGRLSYGGEIGVAMYTNDQYQYDLTAEGQPGRTILVDEEDCFWTAHASLRYEMFSSPSVSQYIEVRVGGTTFFSSIIALEDDHSSPFEDKFSVHGTAFNTAFGTGVTVDPQSVFSKGERQGKWLIDVGMNVHSGSVANYRNFKTAESSQLTLVDGGHKSLTNYIDYRLGVLLRI